MLSGSDQLTLFIVANALLEGVKDISDLKEMIGRLRDEPPYKYFIQADSFFSNSLYEDFDSFFENSDISTLSISEDSKSIEASFEEENELIEIYKSFKENSSQKKLLQCLWVVFEFLDSIDFDVLHQLFSFITGIKIDRSKLKKFINDFEDKGFIYTDYENILLWDLPQTKIYKIEGKSFLSNTLRKLIPFFSKINEFRMLLHLGGHFYFEDRYEDAISCYENIIQYAPFEADKKLIAGVYNNWGLSLVGMKQCKQACEKYQKALEIDDRYAQPHRNWGSVLIEMLDYKEACGHFQQAIKIEPSYIEAYYDYGRALEKLKNYKEAHKQYKNAIKLNPYHIPAYNNDGNTLIKLERFEEATLRFKKVIEIDPEFAGAYFNLGRVIPMMNYYKSSSDEVFELFLKAFFLFIIRKEWKFAYKTAVFNILNNQDHSFLKNVVYIFNIGVDLILNPSKKLSDTRIKRINLFKNKVAKIENNLIKSSFIVIDAILDKKIPEIQKCQLELEITLSLRAGIILANEVAKISPV